MPESQMSSPEQVTKRMREKCQPVRSNVEIVEAFPRQWGEDAQVSSTLLPLTCSSAAMAILPLLLFTLKILGRLGCGSVVEPLPTIHEALGLIPSTQRKTQKKKSFTLGCPHFLPEPHLTSNSQCPKERPTLGPQSFLGSACWLSWLLPNVASGLWVTSDFVEPFFSSGAS